MKFLTHQIFILFSIIFGLRLSCHCQPSTTLKVGDQAPIPSPFEWIKGNKITEWKKGTIYVVDFGATWCQPCAAAIPELSALQQKYKNEVVVASFFVMELKARNEEQGSADYVTKVKRYVSKRGERINYTVGVDSPEENLQKDWLKAAGVSGIPQIFLIDKKGIITWIGTSPMGLDSKITLLLSDSTSADKIVKAEKSENAKKIKYDSKTLLLIDNNGGEESDFLFRSLLARYDGKINASNPSFVLNNHLVKPDDALYPYSDKHELIGVSIAELYYQAYSDTLSNVIQGRNYRHEFPDTIRQPHWKSTYGKAWFEPILEVTDKTPFVFSYRSIRNRYNYSLKVPKDLGTAHFLQSILRRDLDNYFGFHVTVEMRSMLYWKLSVSDKAKALSQLRSKDQTKPFSVNTESPFRIKNAEMRDIIVALGSTFGSLSLDYGKLPRSDQGPFIDETTITYKIDFMFDRDMTFEQTVAHLRTYGLELAKSYKPMKVVVIRD